MGNNKVDESTIPAHNRRLPTKGDSAPFGRFSAVVLSAFGDESCDESKQRVFAVAALLGSESKWETLVNTWVTRTSGKEFHASECESEFANDPDKSKHKSNLALYKDLTILIVNSGLHGVGVAVDLASQRESFPGMPQDFGYYHCFAHLTAKLVDEAKLLNELSGSRDEVEFTFDHRQESEYNAGLLYDFLVNSVEWKHHNVFMDTKISFDSRKNPRIQAADLFARETMKEMDRIVTQSPRRMRGSMKALMDCKDKFRFFFFDREWETRRRQIVDGFDTMQKALGKFLGVEPKPEIDIWSEYQDWLVKHRIVDNLSNRFRYLVWRESGSLRQLRT
jgi:hypothetical protein